MKGFIVLQGSTGSYSNVRGVEKIIPIVVYLHGCPPKPEAITDAM